MNKAIVVALIAAFVPIIGTAATQTFNNTVDQDIANSANWDVAPTFDTPNANRWIIGGTTEYTAAQGATTLTESRGLIVSSSSGSGDLTISGGSLTLAGDAGTLVGWSGNSTVTAKLTVATGGILSVAGTGNGADMEMGVQDWNAGKVHAELNVAGGLVTINDDLKIGLESESDSSFEINVSAGTLIVVDDVVVGNGTSDLGDVQINISGGTMNTDTISGYSPTSVNLTGGTLKTRSIYRAGGSEALVVNFDGGILKNTVAGGKERLIRAGIASVDIGVGGGTVDTSGADIGIESKLTGSGTLSLEGGGSVLLHDDSSSFSGVLEVASGVLLGGLGNIGSADVTLANGAFVGAGGQLKWSGTGNSISNRIGELTLGTLSVSSGSATLETEYDANGSQVFDLLTIVGDLDISSLSLNLMDIGSGSSVAIGTYVIASFGSLTGTDFSSVSGLDNPDWSYSVNATDVTINVIPEPATLGVILLGGGLLCWVRRIFMV